MRARHAAMLSLVALALPLAPLAAQRVVTVRSDSAAAVPAELALALVSGWAGGRAAEAEIVVGTLPTVFPAEVLPETGGRALGAFVTRDADGRRRGWAVGVIAAAAAPDSAIAALRARLARAGWRPAPDELDLGREGFVEAHEERPRTLCRDSLSLDASAVPRATGGAVLRVVVQPTESGRRFSRCSPERARRMERFSTTDAPMPTLRAPAGADSRGGGSSVGPSSRTATARIRSALTPARLVAHYAAQLREEGWALDAPLAEGALAAQAARLSDGEGRVWHGALVAMRLPGDENVVEVSFHVARADPSEF